MFFFSLYSLEEEKNLKKLLEREKKNPTANFEILLPLVIKLSYILILMLMLKTLVISLEERDEKERSIIKLVLV